MHAFNYSPDRTDVQRLTFSNNDEQKETDAVHPPAIFTLFKLFALAIFCLYIFLHCPENPRNKKRNRDQANVVDEAPSKKNKIEEKSEVKDLYY